MSFENLTMRHGKRGKWHFPIKQDNVIRSVTKLKGPMLLEYLGCQDSCVNALSTVTT